MQNTLHEFSFRIKFLVLAIAYFPHKRVSSAQQGLTSLFGMGRGVTLATNHQDKKFELYFLLFLSRPKSRIRDSLESGFCFVIFTK